MSFGKPMINRFRRTYSVHCTQYLVLSTSFAAAVFASFFIFASSCPATEPAASDAVAAGKDALTRGSRFPWYDRRNDDVRRLNMVPRQTADDRGAQWTATPTNTPPPPTR